MICQQRLTCLLTFLDSCSTQNSIPPFVCPLSPNHGLPCGEYGLKVSPGTSFVPESPWAEIEPSKYPHVFQRFLAKSYWAEVEQWSLRSRHLNWKAFDYIMFCFVQYFPLTIWRQRLLFEISEFWFFQGICWFFFIFLLLFQLILSESMYSLSWDCENKCFESNNLYFVKKKIKWIRFYDMLYHYQHLQSFD